MTYVMRVSCMRRRAQCLNSFFILFVEGTLPNALHSACLVIKFFLSFVSSLLNGIETVIFRSVNDGLPSFTRNLEKKRK